MNDEIMREILLPRPDTPVLSTAEAFNLRPSTPSRTGSVLASMTNRPIASGSSSRLPFNEPIKREPLLKSSSRIHNIRNEASTSSKTSSARYHHRGNAIQMTQTRTGSSSSTPRSPPKVTFHQKLRSWSISYYGKSADLDPMSKEHRITILSMAHFSALKEYLEDVDYNLLTKGWRLQKEDKYDEVLTLYKALRHLYYYMKKQEFQSKIDRDGDWIMGYLIATYYP